METLKFKTNINCGSCISNVSPFLKGLVEVKEWDVDTSTPEKVLSVTGEHLSADEIMKTVKQAGYKIEPR